MRWRYRCGRVNESEAPLCCVVSVMGGRGEVDGGFCASLPTAMSKKLHSRGIHMVLAVIWHRAPFFFRGGAVGDINVVHGRRIMTIDPRR